MRARNGHESRVSKVTVRLSADEIAVVCNCINEALDALTDGDFQLRVGADRQQARALLARLDERRTAARRAGAEVASRLGVQLARWVCSGIASCGLSTRSVSASNDTDTFCT